MSDIELISCQATDYVQQNTSAPLSPNRSLSLQGDNVELKRTEILHHFTHVFDLYEALFDHLNGTEAWVTKANNLRHPLIFYYGHTAAFFINKLIAAGLIHQRIDAKIESTVAIGVDEMSWDDVDTQHYQWPSVGELHDYRAKVRAQVTAFIKTMPLPLPINQKDPAWVILMGIEHERIHFETSSVLIRQLPLHLVNAHAKWPICPNARHSMKDVPKNTLIPIQGGNITLGKSPADMTYGWDNEYGQRKITLAPFQASQMLVSNAEFLDFVKAGGYQEAHWWNEEGWRWREYTQAQMPTFWRGEIATPEKLQLRLMCEQVAMPWDWPVEVNQLEAQAFCSWKAKKTGLSIQLPSEAEWQYLHQHYIAPAEANTTANLCLEHGASSCPVNQFSHGPFFDLIGNVWQWTSTAIDGFDGFQVHPLYDDFSTPTFDGKHNLIKGGSWISTGNLAEPSARYAFRRHFFQHAGFRYVASNYREPKTTNPYETDALVSMYLDFHYGPNYFGVPNYTKNLAEIAIKLCPQGKRALDIGCAVGRASFELARHFEYVDGVDYSARFIDVALALTTNETFRYVSPTEGELTECREVNIASCGIDAQMISRVYFSQGDACNLKQKYHRYDCVLAANLIDRLREPARFLRDMTWRLQPDGILLLTSPYTWLEEYTAKENWLGGQRENGEALRSYQALQRLLSQDFEEIQAPQDIPFVIRETARKYQHTLAQLTVWRKR